VVTTPVVRGIRAASSAPSCGIWRSARVARRSAALALCALWLQAAPGAAVVHTTGDGSGNTTAPADDPGFAHVGRTGNSLTGVYLGYGWFLTANHVGETSITLGGITYPAVPGSKVQLQYSPGVYSDLALVKIVGTPPLSPLVLSSATPTVGDTVTMIGNGWTRQATQTCWNASFVEVGCGPLATYRGYKALGAGVIRWGRNVVDAVALDVPLGGTTSRAFQVEFTQSGISHEAQAVTGDSGGAAFLKRGSQWQLVGVLFAILVYSSQPQAAVFGNQTLSVDVAHYAAQIQSIIVPPQVPTLPWPAFAVAALALAAAARRSLTR
jgi:hypothetical protein